MTRPRFVEPTRQHLLWVPPRESRMPIGGFRLPWTGSPIRRVWTLYPHTDETTPPTLPYDPKHNENAFLEDRNHDWIEKDGVLHYFSRVSNGGHWLLVLTD